MPPMAKVDLAGLPPVGTPLAVAELLPEAAAEGAVRTANSCRAMPGAGGRPRQGAAQAAQTRPTVGR